METLTLSISALIAGFFLDRLLGDPEKMPHPIVGFGKIIHALEKRINSGKNRFFKGLFLTVFLVGLLYGGSFFALHVLSQISPFLSLLFNTLSVFFCLSGLTLRKEVKAVFDQLEISLDHGRKQLSRIVGRDTSELTAQQVRTAALETLSENLSDGVIAPLWWYMLLGAPGMLAYKMINTLDSMIGYKNDRYLYFGRFAARLDDVANFIPARITACLMLIVTGNTNKMLTVFKNGKKHSSPNSGYPEAALAYILDCRFGGPNFYFGALVEKPYIGENIKELTYDDLKTSLFINNICEITAVILIILCNFIASL